MDETQCGMKRRQFLQVSCLAGAGLLVGCSIQDRAASAQEPQLSSGKSLEQIAPNAWIRIGRDDYVTVIVNHSEMGQGIHSGMAMIVAEELAADFDKIRTEHASMDPVYANPTFGFQMTAGSTAVRTCWEALRTAGATTRELLVSAAASTWGVPLTECRAQNGKVIHKPTKRSLRYGELVQKAAGMPIPETVPLKKPKDFKIIGKRMGRLDSRAKTLGTAVFGIDVKVHGMLTATVVHPPTLGGRLKSLDSSTAKSMPGIRHILPISSGVAVVADKFRQAQKAAAILRIEWDSGPLAGLSSEKIMAKWKKLAEESGEKICDDGNIDAAFKKAAKIVEAVYELPYQAHACPEPMNCTAHVRREECEVWVPTQNQGGVQEIAAAMTGLEMDRVRVHTTFLGGGFGRRGELDFVIEALEISNKLKVPVKVVWTREEDIRNDYFRAAGYHILRAGLDQNGKPKALNLKLVTYTFLDDFIDINAPAILPRWLPRPLKNVVASMAAPFVKRAESGKAASGGLANVPYEIENFRVRYIKDDPGIHVGAWRSVAYSRNVFVMESFLDELAVRAGKDPLQYRCELLGKSPRHRAVLTLAAKKAGWGIVSPKGIYRGIALHDFYDTAVAMVAEVSVNQKGSVRVHRVVCAVDCGTVINPKNVEAQIAGGVAYGLTATLKGSITIKDGHAEQSNFDDFPLIKFNEMPPVEVHIVPSIAPPTGIGEVGVPPIGPAVANAVFAATGKRIRKLPIMSEELIG